MDGIVSLLDDSHDAQVRALWDELEQGFGLEGVRVTPFPHFSYHVAESYDLGRLRSELERLAGRLSPFSVRATGLGIFAGAQPVLYVPVVRSAALSSFHETVWRAINDAADGIMAYYEPRQWIPHITLACGDLEPEILGKSMALLGGREIAWDIRVDNVAIVHAGAGQKLFRYDLGTETSG